MGVGYVLGVEVLCFIFDVDVMVGFILVLGFGGGFEGIVGWLRAAFFLYTLNPTLRRAQTRLALHGATQWAGYARPPAPLA